MLAFRRHGKHSAIHSVKLQCVSSWPVAGSMRPVTAAELSAERRSRMRAIDSVAAVNIESVRRRVEVKVSTARSCSARVGKSNGRFRMSAWEMFCMEELVPVAASWMRSRWLGVARTAATKCGFASVQDASRGDRARRATESGSVADRVRSSRRPSESDSTAATRVTRISWSAGKAGFAPGQSSRGLA